VGVIVQAGWSMDWQRLGMILMWRREFPDSNSLDSLMRSG